MVNLDAFCVFDWRYGSGEMRSLFSYEKIVKTYIEVENALLNALAEVGIAPSICRDHIKICGKDVGAKEVYEREKILGHDIASLAYILGEKCGECGNFVHLGATSYDIVDTTWAMIIRDAISIIKLKLKKVISDLIELSWKYADSIAPGRTHGQHALPITFGFKFANYAYELARSLERLKDAEKRVIKSKVSGAVGTMAAWEEKGLEIEKLVSKQLGVEPHVISTQVAPRDGFAELISSLAILASQLDRFALEVRELSRTEVGEMYEVSERVGSSAMPHKRNPVTAERISGLAKVVRSLVLASLENVPLMHERDLTNSSSERVILPHAFMAVDQMLEDTLILLESIYIDEKAAMENLELTRGAVLSEKLVVLLVERGYPRHEAHKRVMQLVRSMDENDNFIDVVARDEELSKVIEKDVLEKELKPDKYLGSYRRLIDRATKYAEDVLKF
ncbi:MAG: adenylosuccinate lyase [Desulfurococcales archaeon]|jgi:adenylosuccinate lyase